MAELRTNLLTAEDLRVLKADGPPDEVRPDLAIADGTGGVTLTLKGWNYYKVACAEYGLQHLFSGLHTEQSLTDLAESIVDINIRRANLALEAQFLSGNVPRIDRKCVEESLYGTFEGYCRAMDARRIVRSAGANVVPLK